MEAASWRHNGITGYQGIAAGQDSDAPALGDETPRTEPKLLTLMENQGDVLGSGDSAVLGVRSWAVAAPGLPPHATPFPKQMEKKANAAFPFRRAARAAPIVPGSPAGMASSDIVTPPRGHHGPENSSSRWGIGTGAASAVTSSEGANPAGQGLLSVPAEAEERCSSWKPLGSTSAN